MHTSVLLKECLEYLGLQENSVIVDCTLGRAGHSSEILKKIPKGHLYAFDQDEEAILASRERLSAIGDNFTIIKSNFAFLKEQLQQQGITQVDGILFDLGVSSPQLDEEERGFSFHKEARLDMRMDQSQILSAYEVVNTYSYEDLTRILYQYGEEKYAASIVKKIIQKREEKPIETTLELVQIIQSAVPAKYKREKHPARKTFQAIRMEVNRELEVLEIALKDALTILRPNGRICVITFHSLEDKLVKTIFRSVTEVPNEVKKLPVLPEAYQREYQLVKVVVPKEPEVQENKRARSAKLRVIERIKEGSQ